jgi:uncharacterized protein (TIGR04255 family)
MAGLYKNAPLQSATFEARFHGDLAIESRRHEFQRLLKPEYPLLYVPNAALDKAPALQHYRFRKEDGSATVMVAVNSFVYTSTKYPGFEAFKKEIERLWSQFSGFFDIPAFTRLGLRYINRLPIIRDEKGTIQLSRYVTANMKVLPSLPAAPIFEVVFLLVSEMQGGLLRFLMQNDRSKPGAEVLNLDLDFYRAASIEISERPAFIETAHEQIERVFLDVISPDYKKIMEGTDDDKE